MTTRTTGTGTRTRTTGDEDEDDRDEDVEEDDNDNDDDEEDDENVEDEDESEIDGQEDSEEDKWSAFSQALQDFETDANIRRLYPKSLHASWKPQIPPCDEYNILKQRISAEAEGSGISPQDRDDYQGKDLSDYQEFVLRDFEVYVSVEKKRLQGYSQNLQGHMQNLDMVSTECKRSDFYVDGYLEHEGVRQYIHRAHIRDVSIGCLQDISRHSARDHIFLQSELGYQLGRTVSEGVWYRLQEPALEYSDIFSSFLWVADFAKHFVDYLTIKADGMQDVSLEDFQANFIGSLQTWHGHDACFQAWHAACAHTIDFRQHVARHVLFLHERMKDLDDNRNAPFGDYTLWKQIYPELYSSRIGPKSKNEATAVTQNVMKAFCATFPKWGPEGFNLLKVVDPAPQVEKARQQRMKELGFPDKLSRGGHYHNSRGITLTDDTLERVGCAGSRPLIEAGDVVGKVVVLRRNEFHESDPKFECSYAYVQNVVVHRRRQSLSIIWVLPPRRTMCHAESTRNGDAHYGVGNELFFSDECCCKPVLLSNVMGVFGVSLFSDHAQPNATFFIREKYLESDMCFITAKASDLRCSCHINASVQQQSARSSPLAEIDESHTHEQSQHPKLNALSLFCGCGLLDRGLEDSQTIKVTCSIDVDECAVQTSLANQTEKGDHLTASVNYIFKLVRRGHKMQLVFDMLQAGNPCVSFSKLNRKKAGKKSQRNASLLASVLSYVEHFLPRYVLIENVPEMDTMYPACAQAVCCLLEMGYQVRKVFLTASACKAPQLRKRLFIMAASPGLPLPRHPLEFVSGGSTPTVSQAIREFPKLDNDTVVNLTLPDHIPLKRLLPKFGEINLRALIQKVPKPPSVGNLFETFRQGLLNHLETQWFLSLHKAKRKKGTKCLGRINPDRLFPAVVTTVNPLDFMSGPFIHPYEDRIMSLEELKIPHGCLSYVFIGALAKQFKQLGNTVARPVGVVLGLSFAESWHTAISEGLIPTFRSTGEDTLQIPTDDQNKIGSIAGKTSVLVVADSLPSDTTLIKREEDDRNSFQTALDTLAITIEDCDSSSESPSQTSRERSRLSSAFSARDSLDRQLQTELEATIPNIEATVHGPRASVPDQGLARRRKRMRSIPDSDNDDSSEQAQFAITSPAVKRQMDGSRARKNVRTTSETLGDFNNTAENP